MAAGLVSCSGITDVRNEPGTRYAGIDPTPNWVVVKAENATYSPFLVSANTKDGFNSSPDSPISIGMRALTTDAQDLVVRKGNQQLEINQPIFSNYGAVKVGDVGGVLYVTNNTMMNNVWRSNKKKYPRFVPSRAFNNL